MQPPSLDAPNADWLVYADALQQAGDPRGELMGLAHAVAEGKITADVRDAYVKERGLLGDAAEFLRAYDFDWRLSGVRVRVGAGDPNVVAPLLASPLGRELRAITLVGHTDNRAPVDLN